MKYTNTSIGGSVEILASKDFQAIPIKVAGSAIVKAGTPMNLRGFATTPGGEIDDTAGILLYDVDPAENPNGALVVHGIIDAAKAYAHSGVSLANLNVPGIVLRTNIRAIGKNTNLSELTIGALVLNPTFDPNVTAYTAATSNAADAVSATAADSHAIVAIENGSTTVTNGQNASWSSGENTLTVTVIAENGTEKVYTVVVTKSQS